MQIQVIANGRFLSMTSLDILPVFRTFDGNDKSSQIAVALLFQDNYLQVIIMHQINTLLCMLDV